MTCNIDIPALRKKLRLTQVELAKLLDIGGNYVYMLENGRRSPSAKIIKKLKMLESEYDKRIIHVSDNNDLTVNEQASLHYRTASAEITFLKEELAKAYARELKHLTIIENLSHKGTNS